MSKPITLTIDGKSVTAPEGTLIVDAAKKVGIDIPVFCYHPKMEPVGMCRMCLVEIGRPVIDRATGQPAREADGALKIQFGPKLETACTTPISEGMVVLGMNEKVERGRKDIVEFILTSHPLDCPVCDKGGECPLQNLTIGFGPGESRFRFDEKLRGDKHVPLGELIFLDRERCIQCGRCVRFQSEIAGDAVIGFHNRGRALEIATSSEPGFDSVFSGNTTDICPVGALTTADFRFRARPWELKTTASICTQCPVGCNLAFSVRREAVSGGSYAIKRALPRQNEAVNEIWICDKGRFGYHYATSKERLTQPMARKNGELTPVSWEEALQLVGERLSAAGEGLLTLAGGRLSNEDLFNLCALTDGLKGQKALYTHMAGGDLVAQFGVGQGSNLSALGKGSAILVVASDLEQEAPIWYLRVRQAAKRGATLIVANPRPTKLDLVAGHVIRYSYGNEAATVKELATDDGRPATDNAAKALAEAENLIVFFGSEGLGLQGSQTLAQACAALLASTNHVGRANNGLIGVWPRVNEQGAWDMGFRPLADLKTAMKAVKALYIVAADPAGDDPALAEAADFLVVQDLFLTHTARLADVVLPAQSFVERDGSFTSGERRVQRFYPAVPAGSGPLPDYAISAQIGQKCGLDLESASAARVMNRIAAALPDYAAVSFRGLAATAEQWPIIGHSDLYYGGSAYDNTQGLGIQLAPAAQQGKVVTAAWPQITAQPAAPQPESGYRLAHNLLAVPVTRLYDQGMTLAASDLLQERKAQTVIWLNPGDAARLKIEEKTPVDIQMNGVETIAAAHLDAAVPSGTALVPRSVGLPLSTPTAVEVRLVKNA